MMATTATDERRWSRRLPRDLEVVVLAPGSRPLYAHTRDISLGGLFLIAPSTLSLETGVSVGFGFAVPGGRADFRMHASVVRKDHQGFALAFECFDIETVKDLRSALYRADERVAQLV